MRKVTLITATFLAGAITILGTGCNRLKSRDDLNKGVNAYRNAKYSDAVSFFQEAIELDPENANARTYLAIAYMMQWIPGAQSAENMEFAAKAREEFNKVLQANPQETTALASLASLSYNEAQSLPLEEKMAKLDEAAKYNEQLIAADPNNARDAYYSLGVISQNKFYPALMTARINASMKADEPGPLKDKKAREELKAKYDDMLQKGIDNLQKSLDIDKEYDDAMAYMNLLVRERADLADDKDEYNKQIEVADNWLQKALDTKKAKQEALEKKNAGGIHQD
jgi:tetratricopeptide (TPR) repeat protein